VITFKLQEIMVIVEAFFLNAEPFYCLQWMGIQSFSTAKDLG